MKVFATGREAQRTAFVDSLYKSLRKKTEEAIEKHNKIAVTASTYLNDGLDPQECIELLMIEGNISREAASSYVNMAQAETKVSTGQNEYSFVFEDVYGKVWSSHDIGKTITASSTEEAWEKAEEMVFSNPSVEPEKIVSVDRIS